MQISVPRAALVIVKGGSPCQDLSEFSEDRGLAGLTGPNSCDLYVFYFVLQAIMIMRPDIVLQVVVENVAGMRPRHAEVMRRTLGAQQEQAVVTNADVYGPFPRRRVILSSLPPPRESHTAVS